MQKFCVKATIATMVVMAGCIVLSGHTAGHTLTFAHGVRPGNPRHDGALQFKELVEDRSGGRITVTIADSASRGDDADMLLAVQSGQLHITANSQGAFAQHVPPVGALGLPFLFSNLTEAWAVLDGPIGDELVTLARDRGFEVLAWWDNGIRHISHVSKPIRTADDLAGVRIRTPPDKATIDLFTALGAQPAPLAWSKLPDALRASTFEAQENPLTNIYSAGLEKITRYISLSAHKYEVTPVVASTAWMATLSADDAALIRTAARQAGWYQRGLSIRDDRALVGIMKAEGVQLSEVDVTSFKTRAAVVYDIWRADLGDFVTRLVHEARSVQGLVATADIGSAR